MLAISESGRTPDKDHRGPRERRPRDAAADPERGATGAAQLSGLVLGAEDNTLRIQTTRGVVRARRAASCLLDPCPGDDVLVALIEDGRAYVLAVLERPEGGPAKTLSAEGDLSLRVPAGKFEVVSREGIDLVTAGDVSVTSAGVAIQAAEGRFGVDRLLVFGRELLAEVSGIKAVADTVDGVFERLSQRVKRAYRTVEELDRLRAGRVDYRAEKTMHLSGEDALLTATGVAKVDGEHVHIG